MIQLTIPKTKQFDQLLVKACGLDFRRNSLQIIGCYHTSDGEEGEGFTVSLDGQAFLDFYATWTTHDQLYTTVLDALKVTGTIDTTGEPT